MTSFGLPLVLLAFGVAGCAGSKMSMAQARGPSRHVSQIAIAPGSGPFADAIATELFNRGVSVVDASQTASVIARVGLNEFEVTSTRGLSALRESGIEAVLVARGVAADDGTPESGSARVVATEDGAVVAAVSWQNGWGGHRGSIADRTMRKNLSEAASEIADALMQRMR